MIRHRRSAAAALAAGVAALGLLAPGTANAVTCHENFSYGLGGSYSYWCEGTGVDYAAIVLCAPRPNPGTGTGYWGPWVNSPAVSYAQCPAHLYAVGHQVA